MSSAITIISLFYIDDEYFIAGVINFSKMENWRREEVRDLIEIYRCHECLWKVKSSQYKDRNLRVQAIKGVHDRLKLSVRNVSLEDIRKKIHTWRSRYTKEVKLKKASMKSGVGTADI